MLSPFPLLPAEGRTLRTCIVEPKRRYPSCWSRQNHEIVPDESEPSLPMNADPKLETIGQKSAQTNAVVMRRTTIPPWRRVGAGRSAQPTAAQAPPGTRGRSTRRRARVPQGGRLRWRCPPR